METDQRGPSEILLKLFILQLSTAIAVGHLGSLQQLSATEHCVSVVGTILYPIVPVMDVFWESVLPGTIDYRKNFLKGSLGYKLGCIAGAIARSHEDGNQDENRRVIRVPPAMVRRIGIKYMDWKWVGRLVVLLAYMAQVVATILLLARRLAIVGIVGSWIDLRAFLCAIGGLFIALQSLILHFTGPYAALTPGAGEPEASVVKFGFATHAQIYVIALMANLKFVYWVMGMFLLYYALLWGVLGTFVWFSEHGWTKSSMALFCVLLLLWAIGVASPLYEIVLIRSQFSQTGNTGWRWKDPLSDRLWVF